MNTKKLTEAAMLSSLFVVTSMTAIYTGIAYTLYLDMIVPLFITLIYMRIGFKYTLLSSITSLLIVALAVGDVPSAIWMSQGIIMGLICSYFITKKGTIFDDILYSSILGCFVMILIDIYFSKLTGYSFMKEFKSYAAMFPADSNVFDLAFYMFIATVPLSTVLVSYIGALFIGERLKILNNDNYEKYIIIRNFRKLGGYICCSNKTFIFGVIYLLIIEVINILNIKIPFIYFENVMMASRVLIIYFLLKDSLAFVMQWIALKVKSKGKVQIIYFVTLYLLLIDFKSIFIILVLGSILINYIMNLRNRQIDMLEKMAR